MWENRFYKYHQHLQDITLFVFKSIYGKKLEATRIANDYLKSTLAQLGQQALRGYANSPLQPLALLCSQQALPCRHQDQCWKAEGAP
jgi:hypothetical protein